MTIKRVILCSVLLATMAACGGGGSRTGGAATPTSLSGAAPNGSAGSGGASATSQSGGGAAAAGGSGVGVQLAVAPPSSVSVVPVTGTALSFSSFGAWTDSSAGPSGTTSGVLRPEPKHLPAPFR